MEQHIPQDEIRRIIISDMVKKRNSIVPDPTLTYMKGHGYYGLSFLSKLSYGIPFVSLWSSYVILKWIHSAFDKGSKVIWRYLPLTNISSKSYKVCFIVP